jgi:hypothetical protein
MPGGIQPPLEQWLKWPVPNYHDPPTRAPVILILSCVIGPISIALLCTRLWVRVHLQRNAGVDDWLMLASLVWNLQLFTAWQLLTFTVPNNSLDRNLAPRYELHNMCFARH